MLLEIFRSEYEHEISSARERFGRCLEAKALSRPLDNEFAGKSARALEILYSYSNLKVSDIYTGTSKCTRLGILKHFIDFNHISYYETLDLDHVLSVETKATAYLLVKFCFVIFQDDFDLLICQTFLSNNFTSCLIFKLYTVVNGERTPKTLRKINVTCSICALISVFYIFYLFYARRKLVRVLKNFVTKITSVISV